MAIQIIELEVVDSTQLEAKRRLDSLSKNDLTVIYAHAQTNGKGREGRVWLSPPHCNIYASFCTFLSSSFPPLQNLGQILALAVCQTLEKEGFNPLIKWPNDLLLQEKKVGGILCELVSLDEGLIVINGLGLNVNASSSLLAPLNRPATSLLIEAGRSFSPSSLLESIANNYAAALSLFLSQGFAPFFPLLQQKIAHCPGSSLRFHANGTLLSGTFHALNPDGTLTLQTEEGKKMTFSSGELIPNTTR